MFSHIQIRRKNMAPQGEAQIGSLFYLVYDGRWVTWAVMNLKLGCSVGSRSVGLKSSLAAAYNHTLPESCQNLTGVGTKTLRLPAVVVWAGRIPDFCGLSSSLLLHSNRTEKLLHWCGIDYCNSMRTKFRRGFVTWQDSHIFLWASLVCKK
jgi:hypothetical protein